jgi:pimeloyl-ACP methyl ester carboxylesterase
VGNAQGTTGNRVHTIAENYAQDFKPARPADLAAGVVIEKVTSSSDPTQSYALYLPSAYTPTRKFPILYCFDPGARGAFPVNRFKEAAEKYNYIVVGSNNSRNFATQPLSKTMSNLWEDTHARFSIDERRVYLAGLSGGARVALSVAFAYKGMFAGVIACSAGFPENIRTTTPRSFLIFETSGVEDFNNPEMQALARTIEGTPPASRLVVFAGAHEWLPVALAVRAIEWLELRAMQAGARNKDEALIDDLFKKGVAEVKAAEDAHDPYQAWVANAGVAQDFAGLRIVAEFEQKAATLKTAKEVREAIKQERRMEDEQDRVQSGIQSLIDSMKQPENSAAAMLELKSRLAKQQKLAKSEPPSNDRIVARRVIASLSVASFEQGNAALSKKEYDTAIAYFTLGTEVQPDSPRGFFQLARTYALMKNTKLALNSLQSAATKGYDNLQALSATEFDGIRNQKGYQEIYDAVKQNQAKREGLKP